eukprot:4847659-Ditylum_brightwellii.AAC.1
MPAFIDFLYWYSFESSFTNKRGTLYHFHAHFNGEAQEKEEKEESIWESISYAQQAVIDTFDTIFDPDKKMREEEDKEYFNIIVAKEVWHDIRQHRFEELERRKSIRLALDKALGPRLRQG